MPEENSTIEAEFNRDNVKLYWRAASINGTGRVSSETYHIKGYERPKTQSVPVQTQVAPQMLSPSQATAGPEVARLAVSGASNGPSDKGSAGMPLYQPVPFVLADSESHSPGAIDGGGIVPPVVVAAAVNHVPTQEELAEMEKAGEASRCLILTIPPDAKIDVDGEKAGKSPLLFTLMRKGNTPSVITIKKDGYLTVEKTFVPDGDVIRVSLALEPDSSGKSQP